MKLLRRAIITAYIGLFAGLSIYCAVEGMRMAAPALAREVAAFQLSSYNSGYVDGFAAGLARREPDPRVTLRD